MNVTSMPQTPEETPKRRPMKLIAFVVVLIIAAGAGWFLVLAPSGGEKAKEAPKPGRVVALDPLQINLAEGHYIRVGIALQMTDKVSEEEEIDGSKALDAEIDVFSGLPMSKVMATGAREEFKQRLLLELKERYEDHVMDVYFTEYVTQ